MLATGAALACAVPPLATIAFERWARRRGMLTDPDTGADRAAGESVTAEPAPAG